MRLRKFFLLLAPLVLFPLLAQAELVDKIAAVVNDQIVALSEVQKRAAPQLAAIAQIADPAKRTQARSKALHDALEQLIDEKLVDQQIKLLDIQVSDQDVDTYIQSVKAQQHYDDAKLAQVIRQQGFTQKAFRDFVRKNIARRRLLTMKVSGKVKVTDDDLKAAYNQYKRLEGQDFEVHARHILIHVSADAPEAEVQAAYQKAEAIAEEARKPGVDFAKLAKEKSEDASASDGGDLGWFGHGVMEEAFEKAAFTTPPGKVSDPVRTDYGWHVIKVIARRPVKVKSFAEVKDQLKEKLRREQLAKYGDEYEKDLRSKAIIEVKL